MKLPSLALGLVLLLQDAAVAAPSRGRARHNSVRGQQNAKRQLGMDDKGKNGGGGGGGNAANMPEGVVENANGLIEVHSCTADPQEAMDYINFYGLAEQGDQSCLADPVNGCPGGCCRWAVYFICDVDNLDPYMPCVCNDLTAEPVVIDTTTTISGSVGGNIMNTTTTTTVLNGTAAGFTTVTSETTTTTTTSNAAGLMDPPLTAEQLAEDYPEVLAALEAQNAGIEAEEESTTGGDAGGDAVMGGGGKDDKKKEDRDPDSDLFP